MNQLILSIDSPADIDSRFVNYRSEEQVRTVFIQIYTSVNNKEWLESLAAAALRHFPDAVVTGATTNGEIIDGHTTTGKTVMAVSFFRSSEIDLITLPCREGDKKRPVNASDKKLCRNWKRLRV